MQDESFEFYPLQVHWLIPTTTNGPSPARFMQMVETKIKSDEWSQEWRNESEIVHRIVALHECVRYLELALSEHGFPFDVGEKTVAVLKSVLSTFSIGQAYTFIWRSAKDAAAFYVREGTHKKHAANTVPGSIQRMAERAIAQGWQVNGFRRDYRRPETSLSQVLFTTALRLQDGGLSTVPPKEPCAQIP